MEGSHTRQVGGARKKNKSTDQKAYTADKHQNSDTGKDDEQADCLDEIGKRHQGDEDGQHAEA
jgi:hypothetical protein